MRQEGRNRRERIGMEVYKGRERKEETEGRR